VLEGLFGLTFANSWPLFIIISGVTMAIRPLAERKFGKYDHRIEHKGGNDHGH